VTAAKRSEKAAAAAIAVLPPAANRIYRLKQSASRVRVRQASSAANAGPRLCAAVRPEVGH